MLAFILLLLGSLELGAYLAIARLGFGAGWPYAIAGAIGGMLGLRAGLNAVLWMFSMAFASPAPRLGFARTARLMLSDYLAFLFTFLLVLPFGRLWMPADRLVPGKRTILLVHGYGCSRAVWWLLRRRLEAAGHCVATLSLTPPLASIGKLVPQLNDRIEAVCAATGNKQVTLLGHSMGGLVCRSYLARHGIARVDRLITLATPHAGSESARIVPGRNAREMEPDSLWLRDMAQERVRIPAICLRNPYDNYVMPQDNQRLPGARDVELPPVGHLAMLYDRRVADIVRTTCFEERRKTA